MSRKKTKHETLPLSELLKNTVARAMSWSSEHDLQARTTDLVYILSYFLTEQEPPSDLDGGSIVCTDLVFYYSIHHLLTYTYDSLSFSSLISKMGITIIPILHGGEIICEIEVYSSRIKNPNFLFGPQIPPRISRHLHFKRINSNQTGEYPFCEHMYLPS